MIPKFLNLCVRVTEGTGSGTIQGPDFAMVAAGARTELALLQTTIATQFKIMRIGKEIILGLTRDQRFLESKALAWCDEVLAMEKVAHAEVEQMPNAREETAPIAK